MQYTIVFLGTLDVFTPEDDYLKAYLGGDSALKMQQTISALSHYIQEDLEPTSNPLFEGELPTTFSDVHFIPNKPMVVVDGPDLFGMSVYDKITIGVLLSVNAVLRGGCTLDYVGFSRGGVIAQHVCEELQRIRDAIQAAKRGDWTVTNMANLICDTDKLSDRSKLAYSKHLQRSLATDHIQILRDLFFPDEQFCNLLKFDPVPGGCEGSSVNPWVWTSPRHYTRSSVVNQCVVVAQEDEFSAGFTLSIPEFAEIWHVPGCHPNTNGNPLGHDPKDAYVQKFPYEKTRDVQTWAFYKVLQFVEAHGARLVAESSGRYLDDFYPHYRVATNSVQQACLMYDVYQRIIENLAFYRQFRESSYKQFYVVGYAPESIQDERRVMGYLDQEHPRPLSDYVHFDINNPARQMVNIDHWFCAFAKLGLYDAAFDALAQPQRCVKYVEILLSYFEQAHSSLAADCKKILAQIVQLTPDLLARYYFSRSLSAEDVSAVQMVMVRLAQEQCVPPQLETDLIAALTHEYSRLLTRMNQPAEVDLSSTEQFLQHAEIHYDGLDHLVMCLQRLNDNGFRDDLYRYRIKLLEIQATFVEACENVLYRNDFHTLPEKVSKFYEALLVYRAQRCQNSTLAPSSPGPRTPGPRTPVRTPRKSLNDESLRQRLFALQVEHLLIETRMKTSSMLTEQLTPQRAAVADNGSGAQKLQQLLETNEAAQAQFQHSGVKNIKRQYQLSGVVAAKSVIEEHGNPYYFSGSTYQLIGGIAMVLGLIVAAVTLMCLILGYASLGTAASGVVLGGGVAALGLFGLHKGTQIEGEQVVFSSLIPMPSPGPRASNVI
ncbi:MAG: hypothetical protein NXI01_04925 [Gammaproteobacteria bacterium]|nr:hypothetical protein [Gammaproteobacteria bacterium]